MTTVVNRHVQNDDLSDDGEAAGYHDIEDDDRDSLFSEALADGEPPSDGGQYQRSTIPRETFVQNSFVTAEAESKAREAAHERATAAAAAAEAARPAASHSATQPIHSPTHHSHEQTSAASPAWQPHRQQHGHVAPPPDYQTAISERSPQPSTGGAQSPEPSNVTSPTAYGTMGPESASASASRQGPNDRTWPFHAEPNAFGANHFPTQELAAPFFDQNNFNNDHPFVRNGLFGERGLFGDRAGPSSMRDETQPQRPAGPQETRHERPVDEESGLLDSHRSATGGPPAEPRGGKRGREFKLHIKTQGCCQCQRWVKWLIAFGLLLLILFGSRGVAAATGDGDIVVNDPNDSDASDPDGMPTFNMSSCSSNMNAARRRGLGLGGYKSLSIVEMLDQSNQGPSSISGLIEIRPGRSDQSSDFMIFMSAQTNRGWQVESLNYEVDHEGFEFKYPTLKRTATTVLRGCMTIGIIIEVKPGVKLQELNIDTAHCSIRADENLFVNSDGDKSHDGALVVSGNSRLSALSGSVNLAYWSSRETSVHTISGSIQGTYELLDILDIRSSSGSVHVDVVPRPADPDAVRPASLVVETVSSSIGVDVSETDLPARDYRTSIRSSSGRISGSYILGSEASFITVSSSINVEILPYSSKATRLITESSSGSHRVKLLSPYRNTATAGDISGLKSSHKAVSGSLKITYPQEWTGSINAQSISSRVNLRGKNVMIDSVGQWSPTYAHKGSGHSGCTLRTSSGSIDLLVGDE